MLDAIESRFSTQYKVPPATTVGKVNSVPVVTARSIVAGVVPSNPIVPGITGTVPPMPILPVESPVTVPIFPGWPIEGMEPISPVEAPVKPTTSITTPSTPGVLSDGSAGVQVTSGVAGSHDAVGVNSNLFDSLASIGATDSTTSATGSLVSTPGATPPGTGSGTWIMLGLGVIAVWFLLK